LSKGLCGLFHSETFTLLQSLETCFKVWSFSKLHLKYVNRSEILGDCMALMQRLLSPSLGIFVLFSCAHRASLVPPESETGAETAEAPDAPVMTLESLNTSHGRVLSDAWTKNKSVFESFSKIVNGPRTVNYTAPLSWVKQGNNGWIFHYGNPASNTNRLKSSEWFKTRFNPKKNTATMAGPGVYFSKNSYTSASFGWDVFAFPVKLDAAGQPPRCLATNAFFTKESTAMFDEIGARTIWNPQWSSLFSGDFMAATAAIQQFPAKYDASLVNWTQPFSCLDYSANTEWLLVTNSKLLTESSAPPAMDEATLPLIVAGLDLAETSVQGLVGIGGRFVAMTRILTSRPYVNAPLPPWFSADKSGQLPYLKFALTPRLGALAWLFKNPQVLASFAAYTRKALPKMPDADVAKSGVATFAAAWDQMVFQKKQSNDDLLSFVKTCLELKCP
jgi:hypothetical protein